MIETTYIRRCDICGKQMGYEHVTITWADGHKDDVCHDCTKMLNKKLREMRETREVRAEADDNFIVVGYRNMSWDRTSWDKPFIFIKKFTDQKKAEECKKMREADFDRIVVAKSTEEAEKMLLAEREEDE